MMRKLGNEVMEWDKALKQGSSLLETTEGLKPRRVYVHLLVPLAITGGLSQTMPGGLSHCMMP